MSERSTQIIRNLCSSTTGKRERDNRGMSLVELLVVIAIIAAMTLGASLGISLVFSRDAAASASLLNDALSDARMLSMSKEGEYSITITTVDGNYTAIISGGTPGAGGAYTEIYHDEINLEGAKNGKKIKSIKLSGDATAISNSHKVKIVFDKTKGAVYSVNDTPIAYGNDYVMTFTVDQMRGNKQASVSLITATGKHEID